MPPNIRKAMFLRYAAGFSSKETAEICGVSDNAVRKVMSSGVQKTFGVSIRELRSSGEPKIA